GATMSSPKEFTVAFVGPADSGKSALIRRQLSGKFTTRYRMTVAPTMHDVKITTNQGVFTLHIIDFPGGTSPRSDVDLIVRFTNKDYWEIAGHHNHVTPSECDQCSHSPRSLSEERCARLLSVWGKCDEPEER